MLCHPSVNLRRFGWIIAAVMLSACAGPGGPGGPGGSGGPDRPDGERRGPPPFSNLDLNGDGQLTLDEFKSHKIPHGDHTDVFNTIDTNGDGVITEAEYTSHRPPEPPSRSGNE
jgi:EF-hand domain pair